MRYPWAAGPIQPSDRLESSATQSENGSSMYCFRGCTLVGKTVEKNISMERERERESSFLSWKITFDIHMLPEIFNHAI